MKKEIYDFIDANNLSIFENSSPLKNSEESIYKTKDAKAIHDKLISKISNKFVFSDSVKIWKFFNFPRNFQEIKIRQDFFKQIQRGLDNFYLKSLKKPRPAWSPKYEILVVTENENTLVEINKIGCTTKYLSSERDLADLERYDIVQVIDCENFSRALESLPQTVFIEDISEIYLERYLEILSGWKDNIEILRLNSKDEEIKKIINEFEKVLPFLAEKSSKVITREYTEKVVEEINEKIEFKLKDMTFSGSSLLKILGQGKLPQEIEKIIKDTIKEKEIPEEILTIGIPVSIDEKEFDKLIKIQSSTEFTDLSETIKSYSAVLRKIPELLKKISNLILMEDFFSGVSKYLENTNSYSEESQDFILEKCKNYFLENPQEVNFNLTKETRCSILTGANSGGKTTLLEHIIQLNSLFQLGLPINGKFHSPIFKEIYYFAKNKGAQNKGAFENLLTQMSQIKPGEKTLILADEIEAVTEPGVAGKIISSTAEYFLEKGCFLVIATHLGQEVQKNMPKNSRIDGIEAKGLDENFNLIVDHNPVLGRLAHSTPELIVEKMASSTRKEYFLHLHESLKKN